MSPLKISLLLRMHAYRRPNQDVPTSQAFAPAMEGAVRDFIAAGLIAPSTTLTSLVEGTTCSPLTEKGQTLVRTICAAADGPVVDHGCTMFPPPTRPAPPMPKIKPPRPDYETTLRDEFAMAALTSLAPSLTSILNDGQLALRVYRIADAMMEARNANR